MPSMTARPHASTCSSRGLLLRHVPALYRSHHAAPCPSITPPRPAPVDDALRPALPGVPVRYGAAPAPATAPAPPCVPLAAAGPALGLRWNLAAPVGADMPASPAAVGAGTPGERPVVGAGVAPAAVGPSSRSPGMPSMRMMAAADENDSGMGSTRMRPLS